MSIATVLVSLWALWFGSWMAAALWRDRAARRPPVQSEIVYRILVTAGSALVFGALSTTPLGRQLWILPSTASWTLVVVVLLGMTFTWWARLHLGRLWSSSVTRKAEHHVVDTGPYGLVRHPIYTGIIVAVIATAAVRGTLGGAVGTVLIICGFYVKARLEETFLGSELGREAYDGYRRRVPMLVPFLGRR